MDSQNIEYKESWRDEYIKRLSGFANADGGEIYIGLNDKGDVTGIADAKKLLEEIPNKTRDILGILVDVNLKTENGKHYLEIKVGPYPYPISYKGQYHNRSGGTKQELKGIPLDKFILRKPGLIEAWGCGTIKILNECKTAKIQPPVFTNEETGFSIGFAYKKQLPANEKKNNCEWKKNRGTNF